MMRTKEKILAIVISYKTNVALQDSLKDLINSKLKNILSLEIVVVDGESVKKSIDELKIKFPQVAFITKSENLGVGRSFNLGIEYGLKQNTDYFFLLNADIKFKRDYIYKIYKNLKRNTKVGAISGKVLFATNPPRILFVNGKLDSRIKSTMHVGTGEIDRGLYDRLLESEILNCPILIKREVIDKVGLFREDYFMYYEDTDFYYRVRKAGYKLIVEPSAVAYTDYADENSQTLATMRKHYYNAKNLLFFIDNNLPLKEQLIAKVYILKNTLSILHRAFIKKEKSSYYKLMGIKDYLLNRRGYRKL